MRRALERAAAVLALMLSLQACREGYPGEDVALVSPFDMDGAQRIAALNEIGASAHPAQRWRFDMEGGCGLEVATKRPKARETRESFVLERSMDAQVVFDKETRTFDVHLVAGAGPSAVRLGTVLKSARWTDATQAHLLLQLLVRDCGAASR